jgi:hypothetical protein
VLTEDEGSVRELVQVGSVEAAAPPVEALHVELRVASAL